MASTDVTRSRERLLNNLRSMIAVLNAEIFRLESTDDVSNSDIENAYESLTWSVDGYHEEQEMAALEAGFVLDNLQAAKRGSHRGANRKAA